MMVYVPLAAEHITTQKHKKQ